MKKNAVLIVLITLFAVIGAGDYDNCGCGHCENMVLTEFNINVTDVNLVFYINFYKQPVKLSLLPFSIEYPPKQAL